MWEVLQVFHRNTNQELSIYLFTFERKLLGCPDGGGGLSPPQQRAQQHQLPQLQLLNQDDAVGKPM